MQLELIDKAVIAAFFIISLLIGVAVAKRSGSSSAEFFLSGRDMPWWLLGISMVATTFSCDTPNLVTDIVRKNGVAGNWAWWAFLLTGMTTVFIYARLWRKSGVLTDLGFYELRYGGKGGALLRGFRAAYLGIFFNVMIMASVSLAAIKIGSILLGLQPWQTLFYAGTVTVVYSSIGGLRGVLFTDLFQFIIAMIGSVWAAVYVLGLPQVGGLDTLLAMPEVSTRLSFFPDFSDPSQYVPLLLVPLAVQWWSVWYPGAEPGGGGYIAQRMLSARNGRHAVGATLFFNVAHYALRPWPWIVVALASVVVFPQLSDIRAAFPLVSPELVNDDLAYPAMLTFLPSGLAGLVVAALIAAYMSTLSTHLNWGSSYIVSDLYVRFVAPDATDARQVLVGRISTVVLMALSALLALYMDNALQAFNILLQIGAGTGLIFILRWFWHRINAWTEVSGMIISFVVAVFLEVVLPARGFAPLPHIKLLLGVGITTIGWMAVTLLTQPEPHQVLQRFYDHVRPAGPGWSDFGSRSWGPLPLQMLCVLLGTVSVYCALFATGSFLYGNAMMAALLGSVAIGGAATLIWLWPRVTQDGE